jgi:hypothetical protein
LPILLIDVTARLRRVCEQACSPYLREHVKRFGDYVMDLEAVPDPLHSELPLLAE